MGLRDFISGLLCKHVYEPSPTILCGPDVRVGSVVFGVYFCCNCGEHLNVPMLVDERLLAAILGKTTNQGESEWTE